MLHAEYIVANSNDECIGIIAKNPKVGVNTFISPNMYARVHIDNLEDVVAMRLLKEDKVGIEEYGDIVASMLKVIKDFDYVVKVK